MGEMSSGGLSFSVHDYSTIYGCTQIMVVSPVRLVIYGLSVKTKISSVQIYHHPGRSFTLPTLRWSFDYHGYILKRDICLKEQSKIHITQLYALPLTVPID